MAVFQPIVIQAMIDDGAVRNTQDVDILLDASDIDASDIDAATVVLEAVGFVRASPKGVTVFLDDPDG